MAKPHPHSKFIDRLGGTFAVARLLRVENPRVVSNWRKRGIAREWRPLLVDEAAKQNIEAPRGFLLPRSRAA